MRRSEILAPAGSAPSLSAALAAGADAVYFGVDEGWNARARADNFRVDDLPAVMRWCSSPSWPRSSASCARRRRRASTR
jgi:collagenase-like PrtC family protease